MAENTNPTGPQRKMGLTMMVLAWIVLFGLLALYFDDWMEAQSNPNQVPVSIANGKMIEVTLMPNRQHHYVVSGTINHHQVTFLLDTGATDVVVPESLARRIGLSRGQQYVAATANGQVAVYSTVLDSVEIGDIRLAAIRASINPGMSEPVVLLGMSALRQLEFTQRGDMLILRQ